MLLDSFAWLELLMATPAGRSVNAILATNATLFTSPVVLAEVYSKVARTSNTVDALKAVDGIVARCVVVPVDEAIGRAAGALHAQQRATIKDFGLADAIIVATARSKGIKVLSGDPHILSLPDGIPIRTPSP